MEFGSCELEALGRCGLTKCIACISSFEQKDALLDEALFQKCRCEGNTRDSVPLGVDQRRVEASVSESAEVCRLVWH